MCFKDNPLDENPLEIILERPCSLTSTCTPLSPPASPTPLLSDQMVTIRIYGAGELPANVIPSPTLPDHMATSTSSKVAESSGEAVPRSSYSNTPSPGSSTSRGDWWMHLLVVVGIVFLIIVSIIVICAGIYWHRKRRGADSRGPPDGNEERRMADEDTEQGTEESLPAESAVDFELQDISHSQSNGTVVHSPSHSTPSTYQEYAVARCLNKPLIQMARQEETDLQPVQRPFTDQSMYNSIDQCTAESDISDQHRMHVQGPLEESPVSTVDSLVEDPLSEEEWQVPALEGEVNSKQEVDLVNGHEEYDGAEGDGEECKGTQITTRKRKCIPMRPSSAPAKLRTKIHCDLRSTRVVPVTGSQWKMFQMDPEIFPKELIEMNTDPHYAYNDNNNAPAVSCN